MKNLQLLLWKEIHVPGFPAFTLTKRWGDELPRTMMPVRVVRGQVKYKEHFVHGIENAPQMIMDLHLGNNFKKSVLTLVAIK